MPEPTAFDSGAYCDVSAGGVNAVNGAEVLLGVFSADGSKLLAIAGEKSHKVSLSADTESDKLFRQALADGTILCVKEFLDNTDFTPIGGGAVIVTKYEADSPTDDVRTASVSLTGTGKWTWFDIDAAAKAKAITKPTGR